MDLLTETLKMYNSKYYTCHSFHPFTFSSPPLPSSPLALSLLPVGFAIITIIIRSTHYLFSDWPKAYSEFSKSAPETSSCYRLYNNHVKDTQGHR